MVLTFSRILRLEQNFVLPLSPSFPLVLFCAWEDADEVPKYLRWRNVTRDTWSSFAVIMDLG